MRCRKVLSIDRLFSHFVRKNSSIHRVQSIAIAFGIAITVLAILVLATNQYSNFTAAQKIQNAFGKQYAGLISGKLSKYDNEARGLQALLYALNKDEPQFGAVHVHLRSSWMWNDLSRLVELKESWLNFESPGNDISVSETGETMPRESEFVFRSTDLPVLLVRKSTTPQHEEERLSLFLALPLLQKPQTFDMGKQDAASSLLIEINPLDLQKTLDLFEYTTKFATRLEFTNDINQQFVMHSGQFNQFNETVFAPAFPVVSNEMNALGGRWILQLRPTMDTLKFAGFDARSMALKLTGCFLLGFLAWLLISYSFHRVFMRQRQKLLDNLEQANLDLIEQTHKLHSSKRNAEDFIGILGHEIRNPLTTLRHVQEELSGIELPDHVQHLIGIQNSALTTALDTLNNTLDLKKMELSALQLEIIPFEPLLIIDEIRGLIALQCRNKRIALNIELDRAIPPIIKGDPLRIKQVLLNLMNNAVKFTSTGDMIELVVQVHSVAHRSVSLKFEVIDSGHGIDPAMLGKLMEPYSQADSSIARQYGGTGLGLNIASRIVQLMGGKLQIESTLGIGSKFKFELSFEIAEAIDRGESVFQNLDKNRRLSALQQQFDPDQRRLNLLYVDDNDFNLMIADELLKKSGHQLFTFGSPSEALEFVKQSNGNIDIIISDLHMPEMSGFEFARRVRQTRCGDLALLAAMTASGPAEADEIVHGDFDCVLTKPFDLKKIIRSYDEFKAREKTKVF